MKSKLNLALVAFVAAIAFLLVGCATSGGHNFDAGKVPQIQKGVTTEAELVQLFGPAAIRTVNSGGQTRLTWSYGEVHHSPQSFIPIVGEFVSSTQSSHKTLMVTLGSDGKVQDFSSTAGGSDQIQRGGETRDQLQVSK